MNESGIEISESRLEDFVYEHLTGYNTIKGLDDLPGELGSVRRQVNLGSAGIADIIAIHSKNDITNIEIYELKKGCIDTTALLQVFRYKQAALRIASKISNGVEAIISCHLIGNKCASGDFRIAASVMDRLSLWVYDLCPNEGLRIIKQSWGYAKTNIPTKTINSFICEDYLASDEESDYYHYMKGDR